MNKKHIDELLANNIISHQTARDIEQYYNRQSKTQPNLLLTIFGILGAALAGMGIILIFAHNWDNFSRLTRTVLAFTPLLLTQVLAVFVILKNKGISWKEPASTLLFFAVGAAIGLVSQIYNIPGSIHTFTATWVLLCLPVLYLFRSYALWVLLLIGTTSYGADYTYDKPWLYLLFIAALLPFYFQKLRYHPQASTTAIAGWLLPLSLLCCIGNFYSTFSNFYVLIYMALGCIFYNISRLGYFTKKRKAALGYRAIGIVTILIMLFISSFKLSWSLLFFSDALKANAILVVAVLVLVSVVTAWPYWVKGKIISLYSALSIIYPFIFFTAFINMLIPVLLCNVILLFLGIATIQSGIKIQNFAKLNLGLIIITILTVCRFLDIEMSFAIRGLLFLAVGLGFFIANYILAKEKQTKTYTHEN